MSPINTLVATLLASVFSAIPAAAHDFWLQPRQYWAEPNQSIPFLLQVGHGAERQRSEIRASRIARFVAFAPDGAAHDLRSSLRLRGATDDGGMRFPLPGTYVVALETDNRGRSVLPATRFNDYARHEGLTTALDHRQRTGRTMTDAFESYRRVTKAIVRIGTNGGSEGYRATSDVRSRAHITTPLGLALEIVPERSPYTDLAGPLPVRVFFEGQPLAGALVKLIQLENDSEPVEERRTDASGRTTFAVAPKGTWLLNVVWTKPIPPPAEVDFDTTFSSLTFGWP